jgi:hypothetical protein
MNSSQVPIPVLGHGKGPAALRTAVIAVRPRHDCSGIIDGVDTMMLVRGGASDPCIWYIILLLMLMLMDSQHRRENDAIPCPSLLRKDRCKTPGQV